MKIMMMLDCLLVILLVFAFALLVGWVATNLAIKAFKKGEEEKNE